MYIKYSVDEKLLLLLGFSVAYLLAGASMFEQPGQANSQLISILAPFLSGPWGTTEGGICEKRPFFAKGPWTRTSQDGNQSQQPDYAVRRHGRVCQSRTPLRGSAPDPPEGLRH